MIVIGLVLATTESYVVKELVAAFVVFLIIFGAMLSVFMILVATEELTASGITHLETQLAMVRADPIPTEARSRGSSTSTRR